MFFITQDGESALTIAARVGWTEVVSLLMKTVTLDPQQNKVYILTVYSFHHGQDCK